MNDDHPAIMQRITIPIRDRSHITQVKNDQKWAYVICERSLIGGHNDDDDDGNGCVRMLLLLLHLLLFVK